MSLMCARVCPTENLCEAVCVRNTQEGKPVAIGGTVGREYATGLGITYVTRAIHFIVRQLHGFVASSQALLDGLQPSASRASVSSVSKPSRPSRT